jgi:CheY-like chemotaxis protein
MISIQQPVFLYVEDDPASRQIIEVLITKVMRYEHLTIFENSKDFMTCLSMLDPLPNCIFLDIQMRPYDGYQVLEMLRSDPRFADTTIVAMTANVMSHDVEKLKQVGFNGLIGKPIVKEVFSQLVSRIVAGEPVWYVP